MIALDAVKKIAGLSRMTLGEAELTKLAGQMTAILDFVATLDKLELKDVPPTSHAVLVNNIFREDEPCLSGIIDDAIKAASEHEGRFFRVPKVIE